MLKFLKNKKKTFYCNQKTKPNWLSFFRRKNKKHILFSNQKTKVVKKIFIFNSQRSNFWRRLIIRFTYFLIFILGIILIFIFFFTSFFVIKNINLERANIRVDSGQIVNFLKDYRYRNILTISTNQIKEKLIKKFPEYKEIQVLRIFPNTLLIKVSNFDIVAQVKLFIKPDNQFTASGELTTMTPTEQILAINSEGIAEETNDSLQDLPMIEIQSIKELPLVQGDRLIEKNNITKILEAKRTLFEELKLSTNYLIYFPEAREIHFKVEPGYEIWIDFVTPVSEQIDKLKKISNDIDWSSNPPIDHIDLRVKNRIIYK